MTDEYAEWLKSLKVDDAVAVSSRYGYSISKIVSMTATQITAGSTRYQKKDGQQIGGDRWYPSHLTPITEEIRAEVKHARLLSAVRGVKWETLTTEQIERVVGITKEKQGNE